ncbi:MAG: hypothetical protein JJ895_10355 [Balneolaceae bacterium]|nr:hypothetical protein [Balneolaceae bacterium]
MLAKLLVDFGLVILIWMTQLITYPSFTKMNEESLSDWHASYTTRISILVMPLMIGQIGLHIYGLMQSVQVLQIVALVLVILTWANTFLFAVPLHNQIAVGQQISKSARKLVSVNAWRTGLWTIVFIIDLLLYIQIS